MPNDSSIAELKTHVLYIKEAVDQIRDEHAETRKDVLELKQDNAKVKGAWKAIATAGSVIGVIMGVIGGLFVRH